MCSSAYKQLTSARLIFRFFFFVFFFPSHVDILVVVSALNWKIAEVVFSLPQHSNAPARPLSVTTMVPLAFDGAINQTS